ncbi:MAG TPA: Hsp20/alpha crystallin family protein [Actinomycetota bacterium]|nr:Hsp20/alpha crystallin family protein [Actinomycetota bacterium]
MAIAVRRFSPWSSFNELQRETDQLMRNVLAGAGMFGGTPALASGGQQSGAWMPAVDVLARDKDIVVRAELPGIDPSRDVEISVHDGVLTVRGERRQEEQTKDDRYMRVERRYGSFERTLAIPEGVNPEGIQASYDNGVLEVTIPGAAQESAPRRIPVQVAATAMPAADGHEA